MKKRILPLLLAFCLTAMLLPLTAGAFTDDASIQHKEAVRDLTGREIINGFPDGSFRPNGTLTRAQACTILAKNDLGGVRMSGHVPFYDVSDDYWGVGYIAYCADMGYVVGYGDGSFGPEDTLTGTQWSKMVLTTMGYDAEAEGMIGSNWAASTASLASTENLYDGISGFNGAKPISRDNACQILYNALRDPGSVEPVLPPENPTDDNDTLKSVSYSFTNHWDSFGYSRSYKIPLERYQAIFGDTEKARTEFNKAKPWGGSCYGMVSSAGMFFRTGNGINVSDFNANATLPMDLSVKDRHNSWNISLTEFIELMHVSQFSELIQADYQGNKGMPNLNKAIQDIINGNPYIITIFPAPGKTGHAVLGYDLDTSGTNHMLKIYDPNFPGRDRAITLYGSQGNYTGWYYKMNDMEDWDSNTGGWISYMPYADYFKIWNDRAGTKTSSMALISSNGDIDITTPNGQPVAEFRDGEVKMQSSQGFAYVVIGIPAGASSSDVEGVTAAWVPAGAYNVERAETDTTGSSLQVNITQVEQSVNIVTGADSMTVEVNDSQQLRQASLGADEAGSSFEITLGSSFDDADQPATINYKGTVSDEGSTLGQDAGGLIHEGVEELDIHVFYDGAVG